MRPLAHSSLVEPSAGVELHEVASVAHVHSTFSDGTATVAELARDAVRAGVRVLLLTDHDTLGARRAGEERWHGDVLVVVGQEIGVRGSHLLAFGLDRELNRKGKSQRQICAEVAAAGGVGYAAHPFSTGSTVFGRRLANPHPFSALQDDGCGHGIELWSVGTDEGEAVRSLPALARLLWRPEALDGPPEEHLAAWDRMCARRRVHALGGIDAHQQGVRFAGRVWSPLPNRRWLGLLHTHLLLREPLTGAVESDRASVEDALREGRSYLAVASIASGAGVRFWADGPTGRVDMGAEAPAGQWTVSARLPREAHLRLIRDGVPQLECDGTSFDVPVSGPGVYRLEALLTVRRRRRRWIVTNPLYLRG